MRPLRGSVREVNPSSKASGRLGRVGQRLQGSQHPTQPVRPTPFFRGLEGLVGVEPHQQDTA